VEARRRLADFLREDLRLTGTHVSCEHGVCGACTVIIDGRPTLSCLQFAVQADGSEVRTVEGLAQDGALSVLQRAFWEKHALQCGFCTPGFLMALTHVLETHPAASDEQLREAIDGVVCRCTGYQHILEAAMAARDVLAGQRSAPGTSSGAPLAKPAG
jgi:carbon-monoxide dehydrogenase small subunit